MSYHTELPLSLLSPSGCFGPRLAARPPADPTERRVEQERPAPHRLRAGNSACAVASWALHIGLGFSVAHENHQPSATNTLHKPGTNSTVKKKGIAHPLGASLLMLMRRWRAWLGCLGVAV